jgi:RNA polymerase sigma factor (sigma-70 family)
MRQWGPEVMDLLPDLKRLAAKRYCYGMLDQEDLVQELMLEMARARKRYDPGRGLKWRSYAFRRAQGAVLDVLRNQDWVPRLERYRAKRDGRAVPALLSSDRERIKILAQGYDRHVLDLGHEREDFWEGVRAITGSDLLRRYFEGDRTMLEIAHEEGRSESRICQRVAHALRTLRRAWGGRLARG